jgi:multidrug efflux pump subunit AcrB
MISRFFIDRPIFAAVLSVVITLIGGISLLYLPIAQYPRITPPGVNISISYPGASAQVVADTVGAPIEQQVTGVEGMLYMSSNSGNDGTYSLSVTFDVGTDLNAAVVPKSRSAGHAAVADRGPKPGHHGPQKDARHPHDREFLFSRRPLRRHLSQ